MRPDPRRIARSPLAAALALSIWVGIPGSTIGPFAQTPLVPPASGATYVRVATLGRPVRATRILIPRLRIDIPIRDGVLEAPISTRYAYHYPTTSWPGGGSNTYLYAHARIGAFLNLKYARRGDLIVMRLINGASVKYKVTGVHKVAWNAGTWVFPTSSERLTLQTCLGATQTSPRLVVIGVAAD